MKLYIAIARAVTDIYWNGLSKTSEALGIFYVEPETKKGLLGGLKITGFKETVTGEKIVDRIYYGTEGGLEHFDIDSTIEKREQIGDVAWEIVDKTTADKLLSEEEIQKYMSLSAEEVHKQLQNIRIEARKIALERGNLEMNGRFNSKIDANATYIAIPKAITDIYWNELPEKSEALGIFYVEPETKKGLLGGLKITGFKETVTGEKIVDRIYYGTEGGLEHFDMDSTIEKREQIGDVAWEIVDKATANRLLPGEEIQKYMSLSAEDVQKRLQNIRIEARKIALERGNLEMNGRFNSKIDANATYIAIPRAITDISKYGSPSTSKALGMFFVKPETKKGMLGRMKITGFKEAITGEKLVKRTYFLTDSGVEQVDEDFMTNNKRQIGDVTWEIVDKATADRLLSEEEIQKYMSLSAEQIREQLQDVCVEARKLAQSSKKLAKKLN